MNGSRKQLIAQTLHERAIRDVPDAMVSWPAALARIQQATRNNNSRSTFSAGNANDLKMPTQATSLVVQKTSTRIKSHIILAYSAIAICLLLTAALMLSSLSDTLSPPSLASAAELLQKAQTANNFVPAGKIRHLVISNTASSIVTNFADETSTYEVWLTNGATHLLLRKKGPGNNTDLLVGEDSVWDYNPTLYPSIVRNYPYDPKMLKNFVPNSNIVDQMLQLPNTHVVQNATLDGRPVLLIEQTGEAKVGSAPDQVNPQGILSYRIWLDKTTYQALQHQHALREVRDGVFTDKVDTGLSKIMLDEMKDSSDFPADLFTFEIPDGATIKAVTGPTSEVNP